MCVYFSSYFIYVNTLGAFTYSFIVGSLLYYLVYQSLSLTLVKIKLNTLAKWLGVLLLSFVLVYSKQNESVILAILDSLLIGFFLLGFLKATEGIRRKGNS